MSKIPGTFLATVALLVCQVAAWADGFQLNQAREYDRHVVIQLSPEQVETVGRERKLILTESQRERLGAFMKKVPPVLGVESLGEPDCSCHISSALWTATKEVTIWTDRLATDRDGSRYYHEVRRQPGRYTANANGELFAAGRPVSWAAFEAAVLRRKDGEYLQLSLPPIEPKSFARRVRALQARKHFSHRL